MTIRDERRKALAEIRSAKAEINNQRFTAGITDEQRDKLEESLLALKKIERQLITDIKKELISKLKTDSKPLKELSEKIKESTEKLNVVAEKIEKAAIAIEILIKAVEKGISPGLL